MNKSDLILIILAVTVLLALIVGLLLMMANRRRKMLRRRDEIGEIKGTGDSSFREINDLSLRSLCFLHPDSQSLPELTNFKGQIKEVKGKICIFSTKLIIIN